jgi:hypothetical protein
MTSPEATDVEAGQHWHLPVEPSGELCVLVDEVLPEAVHGHAMVNHSLVAVTLPRAAFALPLARRVWSH